ncbi:large ribosomal subunit protein bL20m-like [Physella acuta]|uniref:large ribosomal subunit protein bL20m-like n=1 Tax=Physella acuta TaxID=109671 RepID=UPI0027DCE4EE|nr:large ribosomal subunit protein bL20m-like [Physella acuta]
MVFLTLRCLMRKKKMVPYPEREWKRNMYRRLAWFARSRVRNCNKLTRRFVKRHLMLTTTGNNGRRAQINYLFSHRIAAGCAQHGVQYSSFMKSMYESNIALNRKMLAQLSVYEPRTFQSLCEYVKVKHTEQVQQGLAASLTPTPSGVITRDMIGKVYK